MGEIRLSNALISLHGVPHRSLIDMNKGVICPKILRQE
ncbi:hypothetical protein PsAD14_04668 [Pseudovibrio sp. Ad14]|nr:hypothetical protein PsW74_03960 [Pseudovibrio sp. W74]KZL06221.1 hypothetical protein PsAD14_04668 [Pseudovibrio sp. Ad14]